MATIDYTDKIPNNVDLAADRTLAYIIHRVEDVTELVRLKQQEQAHGAVAEGLRSQTSRLQADVMARAQEVQKNYALPPKQFQRPRRDDQHAWLPEL